MLRTGPPLTGVQRTQYQWTQWVFVEPPRSAEDGFMPVNRTPKKHRPQGEDLPSEPADPKHEFGQETELDKEKAEADAEWKNLWDQTEVIDMDNF